MSTVGAFESRPVAMAGGLGLAAASSGLRLEVDAPLLRSMYHTPIDWLPGCRLVGGRQLDGCGSVELGCEGFLHVMARIRRPA